MLSEYLALGMCALAAVPGGWVGTAARMHVRIPSLLSRGRLDGLHWNLVWLGNQWLCILHRMGDSSLMQV